MITTIRTIAVVTGLVVASASFANSEFQEPLTLAQKAVQSPLFIDIISSYSAKDFDCSPCQANGALPPNGSHILALYKENGLFTLENIKKKTSWWPWSKTYAWTTPKSGFTELNTRKLNRSNVSIASTIVHERLHDFSYIHKSQYEEDSYCDPAYIVGVVAELSLLTEAKKPLSLGSMVCPSLCERLKSRNIQLATNACNA